MIINFFTRNDNFQKKNSNNFRLFLVIEKT